MPLRHRTAALDAGPAAAETDACTRSRWRTFRVGVVLHGVALVELAMAYGRLPLDNFFETLNLCAFLIALVFLLVEWRYISPRPPWRCFRWSF